MGSLILPVLPGDNDNLNFTGRPLNPEFTHDKLQAILVGCLPTLREGGETIGETAASTHLRRLKRSIIQ